jgi:hypothetical protein
MGETLEALQCVPLTHFADAGADEGATVDNRLFGRALAPAPAGALPNASAEDDSGEGAPQNPVTRAVWARRSHKTLA